MFKTVGVNIPTELINQTALGLKCIFFSLLDFILPLAFQLGFLNFTIIRYFRYIFLSSNFATVLSSA